jgi:cation:H+ antiporter
MTPLLLIVGLAGIALLYWGGLLIVERAQRLALAAGWPLVAVGATVVAFCTSLPELLVSILAAAGHSAQLAFGNAVGSNLANLGLVLGLTAVVAPIAHRDPPRIEFYYPVVLPLLLMALSLDGELSRVDGFGLIVLGAGFLAYMVTTARPPSFTGRLHEGMGARRARRETTMHVIGILIGAAMLFAGAQALVTSAATIARTAGLSEFIIGFTLLAVGTSLPEIVTSVTAGWRKAHDLAVANVTGSNVINLTLIIGVAAVITPIEVGAGALWHDLPGLTALSLLFAAVIWRRRELSRRWGVGLLVLYLLYMALSIAFHPA